LVSVAFGFCIHCLIKKMDHLLNDPFAFIV